MISKKKGFAAAMISNCDAQSARGALIRKLKQFVQLDVFGKCGTRRCSGEKEIDCRANIASHYKFYLAFENSLCKEYVTEKFFRTLNYDIVPVVLGLGDYSKYVPKSGYINVLDYKSPKELADYLIYLDKNPSEYNKYFAWRKHISYHRERWSSTHFPSAKHTTTFHSFCEMCIKLNMETHFGVHDGRVNRLEELNDVEANCKHMRMDKRRDDSFVLKPAKSSTSWCSMINFIKLKKFFDKLRIQKTNSTCMSR